MQSPMLSYFRLTFRFVSLLANGVSLLIVYYVQPIAAKAYNDLCAGQGVTFGDGRSVQNLCITMALVSIPITIARNNILIVANLVVSLITILGAIGLFKTVGNTPYECFTISGIYEDRTSGLDDFDWGYLFVIFFSYCFLLIDLAIWTVNKAMARCGASRQLEVDASPASRN
jgi:hypothetical protein